MVSVSVIVVITLVIQNGVWPILYSVSGVPQVGCECVELQLVPSHAHTTASRAEQTVEPVTKREMDLSQTYNTMTKV